MSKFNLTATSTLPLIISIALSNCSLQLQAKTEKPVSNTVYVEKEMTEIGAKSKAIRKYGRQIDILSNRAYIFFKDEHINRCRKIVVKTKDEKREVMKWCKVY